MAVYHYQVINKSGVVSNGQLDADREASAIERLQTMGYMVIDIKVNKPSPLSTLLSFAKKVTIGDLAIFSRQLALMLGAGIPVTRALYTLSKQTENPTLQSTLTKVAGDVESGTSITDAMAAYPKIFSFLYIGIIRAGELGGNLELSLLRLSEQLQKDKALNDNIKSATFYPSMVAGFAVFIFIAMLVFLVPIIIGFMPAGTKLPLPTKIIVTLSNSIRHFWYIWIVGIATVIFGMRAYIKSPAGKYAWEKVKFKIPAFGKLIHRSVIARFTRTLSTLLNGGISVVQALESSGTACGSFLIAKAVTRAVESIQEGRNIAEPLEESKLFPPMVIHMIAIGEETGALPSLLNKIAEFYEEEVATMAKGLSALIEPIMLIVVGVLVGGMLISLYLPIFASVTAIK